LTPVSDAFSNENRICTPDRSHGFEAVARRWSLFPFSSHQCRTRVRCAHAAPLQHLRLTPPARSRSIAGSLGNRRAVRDTRTTGARHHAKLVAPSQRGAARNRPRAPALTSRLRA